MATNLTINSNYVGEAAGDIIGKAFREADTISRGLINVIPNINKIGYLRKIDYTAGRQDFVCGWNPTGDVAFNEVPLQPKVIKIDLELCKEDFRDVFDQAKMGFSSWNKNFAGLDEATAIQTEILLDTAVAVDTDIWVGPTSSTSGRFTGFIPVLQASGSGAIKVVATASVTPQNVATELSRFTTAIPTNLKNMKDRVFGISTNVADALSNATNLGQLAYGTQIGDNQMRWGRYTLEVIDALPDDTMIFYQKKNLAFGTGLLSDHNELYMDATSPERIKEGNVVFKMVYSAGTAIVRPGEVVLYN